jgi:hypothetical protein
VRQTIKVDEIRWSSKAWVIYRRCDWSFSAGPATCTWGWAPTYPVVRPTDGPGNYLTKEVLMGHRYPYRASGLSGGQLAAVARAVAISVGLLLSLGTAAVAAAGAVVVAPTGKVAGEGYTYYEQRSTQKLLDSSQGQRPCQTLAVNGQRVAYLTLSTVAPTTEKYTCSEPAERPMYAVGIGNECSTFTGDHDKFGTTDAQLRKCARALFKGAKQSFTVDGHSVNVSKLLTLTAAFPVDIPKNPLFPLPPGKGRSAAYGPGLLLTGFSQGTHSITGVTNLGTSRWKVTWTVHVR